jgi:hypothetical protein
MWNWLNGTDTGQMVFSWLKVFLATILTLFIADGADLFAVDAVDLKAWLAAAFAAAIPLVINYINPRDTRYGNKEDELI